MMDDTHQLIEQVCEEKFSLVMQTIESLKNEIKTVKKVNENLSVALMRQTKKVEKLENRLRIQKTCSPTKVKF
jgi:hypothetical protein